MTPPEHGILGRVAGAVTGKVVDAVPVEEILEHVDLDAVLDQVDVNHLLDRIDVNRFLDRVDLDRLLARADVNALLAGVDLEDLVQRAGIPDVVASTTGDLLGRTLDVARRQVVGLDAVVTGLVDRLLRRRGPAPLGPVLLVGER
ncbi:hypothetical protein FHP29_03465 [Nocardioides albidus]|uniref:Uncharacterized protein n=1 Tax=Nocardioides albidus TaxID=1517589 RepID=A0A5C4WG06_9ACTN|nr:hypothetical protein [Nocardioides albidus]TNM47237.1 hypothetical protein FHP29_03465 [Nocardioides albidus]